MVTAWTVRFFVKGKLCFLHPEKVKFLFVMIYISGKLAKSAEDEMKAPLLPFCLILLIYDSVLVF